MSPADMKQVFYCNIIFENKNTSIDVMVENQARVRTQAVLSRDHLYQ